MVHDFGGKVLQFIFLLVNDVPETKSLLLPEFCDPIFERLTPKSLGTVLFLDVVCSLNDDEVDSVQVVKVVGEEVLGASSAMYDHRIELQSNGTPSQQRKHQ